MASGTRLEWNDAAWRSFVNDEAEPAVEDKTAAICAEAQALSAGFRTGIWHDPETGERRGDTPTDYMADVERRGGCPVGIVYTGNYSAMKDNALNNTLLKAKGI